MVVEMTVLTAGAIVAVASAWHYLDRYGKGKGKGKGDA